MKASRIGVHLRTIPTHDLPVRTFTHTLEKSLHCFRYQPLRGMEEALANYGFLEVYTNGAAKSLLENPDFAASFIRNQRAGMPFDTNLRESFPHQSVWVLKHESDDVVAFLSGPLMIREKRQFAREQQGDRSPIAEVIEQETNRTFVRFERPTLDIIEENIHSADDFKAAETLVDVMLMDFELDKEDKL